MSSSGGQRAEEFWRGFFEEKKYFICSTGTKKILQCVPLEQNSFHKMDMIYIEQIMFIPMEQISKLNHINGA